jgi:hypothetical protein
LPQVSGAHFVPVDQPFSYYPVPIVSTVLAASDGHQLPLIASDRL